MTNSTGCGHLLVSCVCDDAPTTAAVMAVFILCGDKIVVADYRKSPEKYRNNPAFSAVKVSA
ncbi:MAG: hypothetical protein AB7C98_02100 [Acidithiobacillus sp.]